MAKKPSGAIVAELGRPETPEETAARKANDSRLYRQRKTVNNLVFSLLVTLGMVVVIVLMVPRGTGGFEDLSIDVTAAAADHSPTAGRTLIAPDVPEDWKAKQAQLRSDGSIEYWYIGYTTANGAYAAVVQAFDIEGRELDSRWIAEQLEEQKPTGEETMAGIDWVVYDHPNRSPDGANMIFGLEGTIDGALGSTTLLVYGTDRPEVLRELALSVAAAAETAGAADATREVSPPPDTHATP